MRRLDGGDRMLEYERLVLVCFYQHRKGIVAQYLPFYMHAIAQEEG